MVDSHTDQEMSATQEAELRLQAKRLMKDTVSPDKHNSDPYQVAIAHGLLVSQPEEMSPKLFHAIFKRWDEHSKDMKWDADQREFAKKISASYFYAFDLYQKTHDRMNEFKMVPSSNPTLDDIAEELKGYDYGIGDDLDAFDADIADEMQDLDHSHTSHEDVQHHAAHKVAEKYEALRKQWNAKVLDFEFLEHIAQCQALAGLVNELATSIITSNVLRELHTPGHKPYFDSDQDAIRYLGGVIQQARGAYETVTRQVAQDAMNAAKALEETGGAPITPNVTALSEADISRLAQEKLDHEIKNNAVLCYPQGTTVHPQHTQKVDDHSPGKEEGSMRNQQLTLEQHHTLGNHFPDVLITQIQRFGSVKLGSPQELG